MAATGLMDAPRGRPPLSGQVSPAQIEPGAVPTYNRAMAIPMKLAMT